MQQNKRPQGQMGKRQPHTNVGYKGQSMAGNLSKNVINPNAGQMQTPMIPKFKQQMGNLRDKLEGVTDQSQIQRINDRMSYLQSRNRPNMPTVNDRNAQIAKLQAKSLAGKGDPTRIQNGLDFLARRGATAAPKIPVAVQDQTPAVEQQSEVTPEVTPQPQVDTQVAMTTPSSVRTNLTSIPLDANGNPLFNGMNLDQINAYYNRGIV